MSAWNLPQSVEIGGREYRINTDYRDILEIVDYLTDPERPEYVRWQIALSLFYNEVIPPEISYEAMVSMVDFIGENEEQDGISKPKLIDWEQDAKAIISDVNKVAGTEIRALPYLHWWTFLSYFRGIGEGQLSTIVGIRAKLANHKKLEKWEEEFYRDHKKEIDFKKRYTAEELAEQAKLKKILGE